MWFLGITDQCVNYSWFSFFCFLYWDIWGNRDWKKTLYLILYCISKVVKIPRMSHTMTRGSTLMDKHFSRLVEVYPFLYHMRMHCQNSLFCKKTIGLHCGCQKQTFLESDFTLRLSLANLSGNSGLKSKLSFCNIQCILKLKKCTNKVILTTGFGEFEFSRAFSLSLFFFFFWKNEACGQKVLPDRSILIRQKLVENAKIEQFF